MTEYRGRSALQWRHDHRIRRHAQLRIGYERSGPADGLPVVLVHGWPDDVRTWDPVLPALHNAGFRTYVPWLRGCGPTRFLRDDTFRSGQLVALGQDLVDFTCCARSRPPCPDRARLGCPRRVYRLGARQFAHPRLRGRIGRLRHQLTATETDIRPDAELLVPLADGDATRQGARARRPTCFHPARLERVVRRLYSRRGRIRAHGRLLRQPRLGRRRRAFVLCALEPCGARSLLCRPGATLRNSAEARRAYAYPARRTRPG